MPQCSAQNAGLSKTGNWLPLLGLGTFRSTPDRGCAWGVSDPTTAQSMKKLTPCVENFALIEASSLVVQILKRFSRLTLPVDEPLCPTGDERQLLTLVVSSAKGCRVILG